MRADELISEALRAEMGPQAIPTSAVVALAYIDEEGQQRLVTAWDDDTWFTTHEGMVRELLRDVLAVVDEGRRRLAADKLDEDG